MKTRPAGMDYGTYKAMCAAKKTSPVSEDEFKALPVDGGDDDEPADGGGNGNGGGEGEPAEPDGDEGNDRKNQPPPRGGTGGGRGDNRPDPKKDGGEGGQPGKDDPDAEKGIRLGDLRKGIKAFEDVSSAAQAAVGGSRETYLKARLDNGSITKSEQAELGRIWAGTSENPNVDGAGRPLRKALTEYLDPEDREVVNAAPLLKGLIGGLQDRLDALQTRSEGSNEATRQLVVAQGQLTKSLCGAVLELGEMLDRRDAVIKSLEQRLGIVEKAPAPSRAVRTAPGGQAERPLNKSTTGDRSNGGGKGGGDNLQKSQVVRGFHTLVKGAGDINDFETATRLSHECATYERTGHLNPGTRAAIRALAS